VKKVVKIHNMEKYWLDTYQKFIQDKKLLEGLIKTYPLEFFKEKLDNILNNVDSNIFIKDYKMLELIVDLTTIKNKHEIFKKIKSLSNLMGYYIVRLINNGQIETIFNDVNKFTKIKIFFAKRFDEELNDVEYLYHVTLKEIWLKTIKTFLVFFRTYIKIIDN